MKVEFFPKSEPKEADKVVVTLWAHRVEIIGYGLKPLVQAMARDRGFSIEVMPEKLAIFAPAQTMYVYAANFVEHKEGWEKESEERQAPSSDLPGAREVDSAEFNAERKGAKKSALK